MLSTVFTVISIYIKIEFIHCLFLPIINVTIKCIIVIWEWNYTGKSTFEVRDCLSVLKYLCMKPSQYILKNRGENFGKKTKYC